MAWQGFQISGWYTKVFSWDPTMSVLVSPSHHLRGEPSVDVPTWSLLSDINVRKHIEVLEMTTRGCREKETVSIKEINLF